MGTVRCRWLARRTQTSTSFLLEQWLEANLSKRGIRASFFVALIGSFGIRAFLQTLHRSATPDDSAVVFANIGESIKAVVAITVAG